MLRIVLNDNDGGQRLDKFLSKALKGLPPSLMYKYIRTKRIKVNGKRTQPGAMLSRGDVVEMYIPEEFTGGTGAPEEDFGAVTETPEIVYEDENIIVCDKRPGLLSHTGDRDERNSSFLSEKDTLIYIIKAYLYNKGEYDPADEASFAPALCNRIDRNTGGLVIAAKNARALREMNELIRRGCITKQYLCAAHGYPHPKSATLRGYLFKNSKTKTVTVYSSPVRGAKEIITSYRTLKTNTALSLSLLEVTLHTGRTHQIRAHLASAGHPLLGEGKYAVNKEDRRLGYKHQALYSYKITFNISEGFFAYLNGRTLCSDQKNIPFLKLFE